MPENARDRPPRIHPTRSRPLIDRTLPFLLGLSLDSGLFILLASHRIDWLVFRHPSVALIPLRRVHRSVLQMRRVRNVLQTDPGASRAQLPPRIVELLSRTPVAPTEGPEQFTREP